MLGLGPITEILEAARCGELEARNEFLVRVHDKLRGLAARKLAREKPGQTFDATALVHEAYLRLLAAHSDQGAVSQAARVNGKLRAGATA